jgi:hypothetical protein
VPKVLFEMYAQFEAENIDDAFQVLAEHFKDLAEKGIDASSDAVLEMDIQPLTK